MAKLLIYESRRLVLPLETVVDAVLELDRERGGRLTLASLVDACIETGQSPGLLLAALEIVPEGFALMLEGTIELPRRHGGFSTRAPADATVSAEEAAAAAS